MRYVNWIFLSVLFFIVPTVGFAGSLTDPGAPHDAASAMYTVTDVYNRLNDGTPGTKRTTFVEPSTAPGPTGKTLNDLYGIASERSRPAKTGQTTSYATGDDGNLQKGVAWPSPRFTDNANGTVTDNLTGLIWLKNAGCFGNRSWTDALTDCNALKSGECGLSDGSAEGNWRLPNVRELHSLIDHGQYNPALPSGRPFTDVQSGNYWSGTTCAWSTSNPWVVQPSTGNLTKSETGDVGHVWPVRGGQ